MLIELGDYAGARARYEDGLANYRARNDTWVTAWGLLEVGHAAWLQGEAAVTRSNALEALDLFRRLEGRSGKWENRKGLLAVLDSLAVAALAQGRKEHAARLVGAVAALRELPQPPRPGPDPWRRPRERIEEAVRAASLEQEFAAAWAEGRSMSLKQAVAFALQGVDAA